MNDTQKRWLLVGSVLLVVLVLLALLFRSKESTAPAPPEQPTPPAANGERSASGELTPEAPVSSAPLPSQSAALAVRQAAIVFAERYGSYSTVSNFTNIEELKPMMTEQFRRDREQFVATSRATASGSVFRGAVALAIGATVTVPDGEQSTRASAVVTTQRSIQEGSTSARTFTQDITLEFLRIGDTWLVDGATWGAEM